MSVRKIFKLLKDEHIIYHFKARGLEIPLSLPVRRYLLPTLLQGGGGGIEPTPPYDFKNGRLYKLQFWQASIYER